MIKATRNNMLNHCFEVDGDRTSWSYIERFFSIDSKLDFKKAPKLTTKHISPTTFEKMRVKFATQILSASVAAGLRCLRDEGKLPCDVNFTIEFIDKMDKLFDILNSSNFKTPKSSLNHLVVKTTKYRILKKCLNMLKKLLF